MIPKQTSKSPKRNKALGWIWVWALTGTTLMSGLGGLAFADSVLEEATLRETLSKNQSNLLQTDESSDLLTLQAVLTRVEQQHPKLKGAELERQMATAKRIEKQGAFDPAFTYDNDTQRYNSNPTAGSEKFETLNDTKLGFLTRYGAKLSVGTLHNYGDIKSPASGTGDAGTYSVGVALPLLRGAGINDKSAAEKKALLGEPLAQMEYQLFRLNLLLKAAQNYWEWVSSNQRLGVQRNLLRLSQLRAEIVKERAQKGDLPSIDTVEAEQEVQRRQEMFNKSERDIQKSAFYLSTFLWNDAQTELIQPQGHQAPDQLPKPLEITPDEIEQAKWVALKNRPEVKQLALSKDITDVDLDLAKNQRLPVLDVYAGPGYDMGGGSIGPTFKAGVSLMVPLRNRTARGQIEQAKLKLSKLSLDQQALVQQIFIEVQDTASELNTAYQRYVAAQKAYDYARQLEEGERIRFNFGDSTLFMVNQRERTAAESQIKVIEIQTEYQQAIARLLAVTAQL